MLIKINTIDELLNAIKADKNVSDERALTQQRYPIRFILFNDFALFKDAICRLCQNNISIKKIENELPFEDGWITRLDMKNLIDNCIYNSNSDIVISPFSEIIRFYDDADFTSFFKEVSMIEANILNLNRRVYLPIIGLEHRLTKFKNIMEGAVIWELLIDKPIQYPIYITKDYKIPIPDDITYIRTSKEWLELWRGDFPKRKILCSSSPIRNNFKNSQPDTTFNLELIANESDFLIKIFNLKSSIRYIVNDDEYWQEVLKQFQVIKSVNFSLDQYSLNHFNVNHFESNDFLRLWFNYKSDFSRWLLVRNYEAQNNSSSSRYLALIISQLNNYSDNSLLELICLYIFHLELSSDIVDERNIMLKYLQIEKAHIPDDIIEKLNLKITELFLSDFKSALKLCSGIFDFEKELIINLFAGKKIVKEQIQNVYPLLYEYLNEAADLGPNSQQNWITEYIDEYKKAKISNQYTDTVKKIIYSKNKDQHSFFEWYTPIRTPQSVLSLYSIDKYYWIDGLGIEWISLIYGILKTHQKLHIKTFEITKANLPSTTEKNTFPNYDKKGDLDLFIHQNIYKYPKSIIFEIDLVYNLFKDIISKIHNQTIAIVSDHGLTSLSRLVDSKKFQFKDEHEGRCAAISENFNNSSEDYIVYKTSNSKYIIALKHASLGDKPIREVHGGCTPEEVLIPTIIISDKFEDSKLESEIINVKSKNLSDKDNEKGYEEIDLF